MKITDKYRYLLLFAVLITIVTVIIFQLTSNKQKLTHNTIVNEKIIQTRSFSVSSDSTDLNTSARGTVFISGDKGIPTHVQNVASVEINPEDWGGVAFYIPDKWYISNITSSYPENGMKATPQVYAVTLNSDDPDDEWNAWVEVGTDHSWRPTGGGTGTVVIDVVSDQNAIHP